MSTQQLGSLIIRPYQVHPIYVFTRVPDTDFHCVLYLGLTLMMPGPYFPITARFDHSETRTQVFEITGSEDAAVPRRND
jgi:hypothetical protein